MKLKRLDECVHGFLSSDPPLFPTDGDMLDYLVQIGEISEPDGLLATWFHRANNKEEMNKALQSKCIHTHAHTHTYNDFFDGMVYLWKKCMACSMSAPAKPAQ